MNRWLRKFMWAEKIDGIWAFDPGPYWWVPLAVVASVAAVLLWCWS